MRPARDPVPVIYDNIDNGLLPDLKASLALATRADFCAGYFNLRGWRQLDTHIAGWAGGPGAQCRLLVGMHRTPREELFEAFSGKELDLDNASAIRMKRRLAAEFRDQLTIGLPTDVDERGLQRLLAQLRDGRVVVKLFLAFPLHAKLYLTFRSDPINPITGFLGSSNLTFAGLRGQGELNIDVLDKDASGKLAAWFKDRWTDRWCIDITRELIEAIEASWAREELLPPYHIYLKMAYHLSHEAREGLAEFRIPRAFRDRLFTFQEQAVRIAARHLSRRGGVILGDVVGLGKTLMASALLKTFEELEEMEALILCPKNLVEMWRGYQERYGLRARIVSTSRAIAELPDLRRYRLVVIDESHNLRNREGKLWRAIRDYIERNDSRCVLLSATPYNKAYADLAGQLGLFVDADADLGLRPEQLVKAMDGELGFSAAHNVPIRSLAAFERSPFADDWRDLMSRYLVRRTRSFIMTHHASTDATTGRKYLEFSNGGRAYFPARTPRNLPFAVDEDDPTDAYARLYSATVVDAINSLALPRYGLGNYVGSGGKAPPTPDELTVLADLSRAGKRLMGFCRTNLFKRLESSGAAFLLSLRRHILRNAVFIHALENGLDLPIGGADLALLDTSRTDEDEDDAAVTVEDAAADAYTRLIAGEGGRIRWVRADLFLTQALLRDLSADNARLGRVLDLAGEWHREDDRKLDALIELLTRTHAREKVLIFTQFADTARYLGDALAAAGIEQAGVAVGGGANPAELAWRFSPVSNEQEAFARNRGELRVLVATDVLSEGQNLQDAHVVVNYDLPWAIIRLIQRVGRVDRIGQTADEIIAYSFLPKAGLERIIALRSRLDQRLTENQETIGSDEMFFEDQPPPGLLQDLYTERAGVLDDDESAGEVDLASYCHQIWAEAEPADRRLVEALPDVVYSARAVAEGPSGALVFIRTADGSSALSRLDQGGAILTESPLAILKAAECSPDEPARERAADHHLLVAAAVEAAEREVATGGALGSPRSVARLAYERLRRQLEVLQRMPHDLLAPSAAEIADLERTIGDLFQFPLRQSARDTLGAALRDGRSDADFAALACALREEDRLCLHGEQDERAAGPHIVCSLGLIKT